MTLPTPPPASSSPMDTRDAETSRWHKLFGWIIERPLVVFGVATLLVAAGLFGTTFRLRLLLSAVESHES